MISSTPNTEHSMKNVKNTGYSGFNPVNYKQSRDRNIVIAILLVMNILLIFYIKSLLEQERTFIVHNGMTYTAELLKEFRPIETVPGFVTKWMRHYLNLSKNSYEEQRNQLKNFTSEKLLHSIKQGDSRSEVIQRLKEDPAFKTFLYEDKPNIEDISQVGQAFHVKANAYRGITYPISSTKDTTVYEPISFRLIISPMKRTEEFPFGLFVEGAAQVGDNK